MAENSYVLAMYDIRGKQEFIFRSRKIKEIVGGSLIIRDCFNDYLFPAAKQIGGKGIYTYKTETREGAPFSRQGFEDHVKDGYIGEVIYDGGGNFFVIYKDKASYIETNKKFYKSLYENIGTLRVLTSYIGGDNENESDRGINFDDYKTDEQRLRDVHRKNECMEFASYPINALPIVQVDYTTSMPLTGSVELSADEQKKKVSHESFAKYEKYRKCEKDKDARNEDVKILDNLVEEKGLDSHLAVIYIDGNSMGAKVWACLDGRVSYEECAAALRSFSGEIERDYIRTPIEKLDAVFKDKDDNERSRFVVYAGDELNFICNAKLAFELTKTYFESLPEKGNKDATSCAGIAIFKSHSPYSEAYRIAEECCESGKKLMKEKKVGNACLVDFEYLQGAVGVSLEEIRKRHGVSAFCRPWLIAGDKTEGAEDIDDVDRAKKLLNIIARSNSKQMLYAAKKSDEGYKLEIERIFAHYKGEQKSELTDKNKEFLQYNRSLVYRMMLVYDLWFKKQDSSVSEEEK